MKVARRPKGLLVPVILEEIYREVGEYSGKFSIDPKDSAGLEITGFTMKNSDGTDVKMSYRRWGTKLTFSFTIEPSTPDGVALVTIDMLNRGKPVSEYFRLWIVK